MKKRIIGLVLPVLILLAGMFAGCGEEQEKVSDYYMYYLNKDKTKTVSVAYTPKAKDTMGMIEEMLAVYSKPTDSPEYQNPMPEDVYINEWKLESAQLYLRFNSDYAEMDNIREVLCRASIVRTLTQIEGVDCISFYVGNSPLVDINGEPVGLMTAESFVENPGAQINTIQCSEITLYFSSKDGSKLVPEVREVHYSSNVSMEKLVIEQLLKGPKDKSHRNAIPKDTKLVGVSVLDGVCFVNLDEGFIAQDYEVAEPIVIYSLVNSLVELPNINKVQIAVNGDSDLIYRDTYDLSVMYERNLDFHDENPKAEEELKTEKREGKGD